MDTPAKPISYDELFPGRFMKAVVDLRDGEKTYTISSLLLDQFPSSKNPGTMEVRGLLTFRETEKKLTLNRTNAECLKGMWGKNTAAWVGKRITLCPREVEAFGAMSWAVRVRGSPDLEKSRRIKIRVNGQTGAITMHKTDAPDYKPTPLPNMDAEYNEDNWHDEEVDIP